MCVKNCFNCRYGWTTGECSDFVVPPRDARVCWMPMTDAQKLEQYYNYIDDSKQVLVGNIDTGYSFVRAEKAAILEKEMSKVTPIKIPDNLGDLLLDMTRNRPRKEYNKMYKSKSNRQKALERIKKVIFNDPYTIVIWSDTTKTIVKAENEPFDPEKGLAMAISKYFFENQGYYYDVFKKWLPKKKDFVSKLVHVDDELEDKLADAGMTKNGNFISVKEYCMRHNVLKNKVYGMIKREEIEAYKTEKGIWMVLDSSNDGGANDTIN